MHVTSRSAPQDEDRGTWTEEESESARAKDALRGEGMLKGEQRTEIGATEKLKKS